MKFGFYSFKFIRDILKVNAKNYASWQTVKGHEDSRTVLVESVLMPLQYPELFSGPMNTWKCVLFHGPPGNFDCDCQ